MKSVKQDQVHAQTADQIAVALRRIIRAIDLRSRKLFAQCGLTVPQIVVLKRLAITDALPVTALTQQVHLSQATVTGIIDRLQAKGLVGRVRSGRDRRQVEIHLTDAGREALEKAPRLLQDSFIERLQSLQQWEQTLILSSLQRVVAMMEARDIDSSPILTLEAIDAQPDYADATGAPGETGETGNTATDPDEP